MDDKRKLDPFFGGSIKQAPFYFNADKHPFKFEGGHTHFSFDKVDQRAQLVNTLVELLCDFYQGGLCVFLDGDAFYAFQAKQASNGSVADIHLSMYEWNKWLPVDADEKALLIDGINEQLRINN